MSLRLRLIVAAASATAVVAILCSVSAYLIVRHELRHQVDVALERRLELPGRIDTRLPSPDAAGRFPGSEAATFQIISVDGTVVANGRPLPVSRSDQILASAGVTGIYLHDAYTGGAHVRIASRGVGGGLAIEVAQDLRAVDATLHELGLFLALVALGGVALAAGLGTIVARAALSPIKRLTNDAERVATTRDLTATIEVHGADEIARLASTLNAMLVAVDEAQRAQRRLVADASHELRTPLTSLRTNLEVLARSHDLPEPDRQALLGDLIAQVAELGALVGQLVELDRTDPVPNETPAEVWFDEEVSAAITRARRNAPTLTFTAALQPTLVLGLAGEIERAASNLLDNAAKWSPPGGTVDVVLEGGVLRVRDHGPGIDPADVPYVFERFYRSAAARGRPGSGLGLSIVKQAADDHNGRAWVEPAPGGGTVACLELPTLPAASSGEAPVEDAPSADPPGRDEIVPSTSSSLPGDTPEVIHHL